MTSFTVTKGFAARAGAACTAAAPICRPASATVICAIPTALCATAARCRETTVCWSEIATDLREIAADIQEMTACTEETARRSRRPTARRREMAAGRDWPLAAAKFPPWRHVIPLPTVAAMNSRLQNQLNMVGACLSLAQSADYKPVWTGKPPADFATDLAALATDYGAVTAKAAQADAATGGAADAKAVAETALEDAAFVLARALANHFKKTGDLNRFGKVDFTKSDIVKLRAQDLLTQTTAIRDLGTAALAEPNAAARGVTAARIATLTAALTAFSAVMNTPRGQIVNRSALLREVETDIAALLGKVGDMDDLAVQFDGTADGHRFLEAWKRARLIVDSGGGQSAPPPTPPTPAK